jgi:Tfp pilus assembly protein PilF
MNHAQLFKPMSRRRWAVGFVLTALIGAGAAYYLWGYARYRAAEAALARHDWVEAETQLARCLKVWFWSAETHLLAAQAARRIGHFDQAWDHLRACRAWGGRDDAIDLESKLLRVGQGDLASVEGYLASLIVEGSPDTPLIAEALTPAFIQTYQLDNAAKCVHYWLKHEPDRVEAWRYRAMLYERIHNSAELLASYRKVVELDPENDQVRLLFAGHLIHEHQAQAALEQFEHLRPRLGDNPQVLGGMACCHRELNHPDEARRLLELVLVREPDNAQTLGERGRLALQFESAAEAEKWLRQALRQRPAETDFLYSLLQALQQQGNHRGVAEVQAQLRRIEADLARLADVTQQIGSFPHDADLRCEAGQIMLRNGQDAEGLRWLESALQEDPAHAPTRRALAEYYQQPQASSQRSRTGPNYSPMGIPKRSQNPTSQKLPSKG